MPSRDCPTSPCRKPGTRMHIRLGGSDEAAGCAAPHPIEADGSLGAVLNLLPRVKRGNPSPSRCCPFGRRGDLRTKAPKGAEGGCLHPCDVDCMWGGREEGRRKRTVFLKSNPALLKLSVLYFIPRVSRPSG